MADEELSYIKLKVFLYKYTPDFVYYLEEGSKNASQLTKVSKEITDNQAAIDQLQNEINSLTVRSKYDEESRNSNTLYSILKSKMLQAGFFTYGANSCGTNVIFLNSNSTGYAIWLTIIHTAPAAADGMSYYNGGNSDLAILTISYLMKYHLDNNLKNTGYLKGLYNHFVALRQNENNVKDQNDTVQTRILLWSVVIDFFENDLKINAVNEDVKTQKQKKLNELLAKQQVQEVSLENIRSNLNRISRFKIDLDEDYLNKIDITDFVSSYNYTQTLYNIDWSITFNNDVLDVNKHSSHFLQITGGDFIDKLSQSENEDDNFLGKYDATTDIISKSIANRSVNITRKLTLEGDTEQIDEENPKVLLSDLIQKYDFISLYIYKESTALDEKDIILTSDDGDLETKYGFSNEFNGFVFDRSFSISVTGMNTFTAGGSGILSLFDRTKVLYSPTIMTSSLYSTIEIPNIDAFTPFANLFTDKTIKEIMDILFQSIYRITPTKEGYYYFNLARLMVENSTQTNLFTIAPFIYSNVMKRRQYTTNYLTSKQIASIANNINNSKKALGKAIDDEFLNSANVKIIGKYSPINYQINSDTLKAYFTFIDKGFYNYFPTLKTPNEILAEVKKASMIEIFEKSNGTVVIRSPKYNDIASIIKLNIPVTNRTYGDTATNLIAREKLNYTPQMNLNMPFQTYSFTNGKNLLQYGLSEIEASTNPNVNYAIEQSDQQQSKKDASIFHYCRLYLELYNAAQKTCVIDTTYQPAYDYGRETGFQVGNLIFDELVSKIFYISSISRKCNIGVDLSMTIVGTYVRDCYDSYKPGISIIPNVEISTPTLELSNNTDLKFPSTIVQGFPEDTMSVISPSSTLNFRILPTLEKLNDILNAIPSDAEVEANMKTSGVTKLSAPLSNAPLN